MTPVTHVIPTMINNAISILAGGNTAVFNPHPQGKKCFVMALAGAPGATEIGGRRAAIAAAIAESGKGDVILLAGKGHEQGQIIGDRVLPFDDVTVARECAT